METIDHNGVTFVKATALAKKHRYTTDYIGQLCRSGKVEAKLIGRAWFVNEKSLLGHKADRYNTARLPEITINKSVFSDASEKELQTKRQVRSVLSKATHRSFSLGNQSQTYNFMDKGAERISIYHPDENHLSPSFQTIKPNNPSPHIETKKVKIELGAKAVQKLAFETIPEVSLRGDLRVESLDDGAVFAEVEPVSQNSIKNIVYSENIVTARPSVRVTARYSTQQHVAPASNFKADPVALPADQLSQPEAAFFTTVPNDEVIAFKPQSISLNVPPQRKISFIVVPVSVALSVLVCALVLGMSSVTTSDGKTEQESKIFTTAKVTEALKKITESY
jgi:hypothetical protein